jgi:hypothetical protein
VLGSPIHITPTEVTSGWASLQGDCAAELANLRSARSADGLAAAWTALSTGRLSSFVTVTMHRAQRLNRLTAAALLTHEQYGLFGDKDIDPYRVWRVVPYTAVARQVLDAVRADIEILRQKAHDLHLDIRAQIGEPGAPLPRRMCLFFGLTALQVGGRVQLRRKALRRRDVHALTSKHFKRPANIGRHFLCTELAMAGTDVWLIAAGTGHGHVGAEVFSDSMAVAPVDALGELVRAMERILEPMALQQVPGSDIGTTKIALAPCLAPSLRSDPYLHPKRTVSGRILPPYADPLTLVALRVVGRTWRELVSSVKILEIDDGVIPACLATLDGIHPSDLMDAQAQMPAALVTTGTTLSIVFRRTDCANEILMPLCSRTVAAINVATNRASICSDAQLRRAGRWIRGLSPEIAWPVDDREAFLAYCALAQRWHRFHEVPSTLAAASRAIFSATANRESVLRIIDPQPSKKFEDLPFVPIRMGVSRERVKRRTALADLKTELGKQGNTKALRGEEQKRSRALVKAISPINTNGDLPALRAKEVIMKECECWLDDDLRSADAGRQYSSLRTYGTQIFDGLNLIGPGDDMSLWPAPDFVYWFKRIEAVAKKADDEEGPSMAGVRRFLLVGRDYLGWDVPDELLIGVTAFKTDGRRKAAASTVIFSWDYTASESVVRRRLVEWPFLIEPALIDLKLRESVAMRSGERSTLLSNCVTLTSGRLILRTTGHSNQKSTSAVRLCTTPGALSAAIRGYAAKPERRDERFLFLDDGGSDWTVMHAIDKVENEAMTLVTGDPSFRPHCGRASAGCNRAWAYWEPAAFGIYHGRAVSATSSIPRNLEFNRTVAATLETGQGHVSTFLTYYASVWPFLRAITVNSQLGHLEPDDGFVREALDEAAVATVRKARSRARGAKEPFSGWDVVGRLAAKRVGLPALERKQPLPVLSPDTTRRNQPPTQEAITNYVLARATGTTRDSAAMRYGIANTLAQAIDIDMNRRKL